MAALLVLVLASVLLPPGTQAEERGRQGSRNEEVTLPARIESEREARVRKAMEEIRKEPNQRKFILFRYGLKEEDLR